MKRGLKLLFFSREQQLYAVFVVPHSAKNAAFAGKLMQKRAKADALHDSADGDAKAEDGFCLLHGLTCRSIRRVAYFDPRGKRAFVAARESRSDRLHYICID